MSLEEQAANELERDRRRATEAAKQQRAHNTARTQADAQLRAETAELIALFKKHRIAPVAFVLEQEDGDETRQGWIVQPIDIGTPDTPGSYGGGKLGDPGGDGRALMIDGTTCGYTAPGEFTDSDDFVPYGYRALATHRYGYESMIPVPPLDHDELLAIAKQVLDMSDDGYTNSDIVTEFDEEAESNPSIRREQDKLLRKHKSTVRSQARETRRLNRWKPW